MNEHETHKSVVKLARRELEDHERINCWFRPEFVRALIVRLEAAHKREVDELKEQIEDLRQQRYVWSKRADELKTKCDEQYAKLKQSGDVAKLREAVEQIRDMIMNGGFDGRSPAYIVNICDAALAAPARNCDVVPIEAPKAADMFHRERPLHGYDYETHEWLLAPATEKEGGAK